MDNVIPMIGQQLSIQCDFLKTEMGRLFKLIEKYVDAVEDRPHPTNEITINLLIEANDKACELSKIVAKLRELNG